MRQDKENKENNGSYSVKEVTEAMQRLELKTRERLEDQKVQNNYGPSILSFYQSKERDRACFLENHLVTNDLRCKMIDWMIEVLSSYKCSETCFFVALETLDLYFQKTTEPLENKDVHLLGVTVMFIASKYEEVQPISIKTFQKKIAHERFSAQ